MKAIIAGLVQLGCRSDSSANINCAVAGIREAAAHGAELIVMPELHNHLYFCQIEDPDLFDLAESIPGPSTDIFGALARELKIVLVISLFERRAPGLYHNTAVVLDRDGKIAGLYRKMHIPHDPGYCEKYYFTPGDQGFEPIDTSVGRLGVLVCWDQWFPEAARLMALAGAEILIYPTAIGWDTADETGERNRQLDAWMTVQRAHAVANGIPVISVNRTGMEPGPGASGSGNLFWGHSFAAGCQGELLVEGSTEPAVLTVTLDPARTETVRRIWPYLRDRRTDAYKGLLKRYL